jgi:hypothetical protein
MSRLPTGFGELDALADRWALPTENARSAVRWHCRPEDFRTLYAAVMPRLDEILALLGGYPADAMPEDIHRLFLLACAFAEASPHHELYADSPEVPFSFAAQRVHAVHGDTVQ